MPGPPVQVSTLILRLARELRTALDHEFASLQLTSQQAGLLIHVFGGQSSPKTLAGLLGTDTAGITRMLDRLERKDLVRRKHDHQDRRAVVVELTESGTTLIPALPPVFERVGERLVGGMDAHVLVAWLSDMADNLEAD